MRIPDSGGISNPLLGWTPKPTYESKGVPYAPASTKRTTSSRSQPPVSTNTYTYTGGGYTGGGGVGANSTGQVSAPVAAPDINAYLGSDTTYQSQLAALQKALADYQSQMGVQQNQYNTNYASNLNQLGQDRTQGMGDQQNDYASRGLFHSGLFAKAAGDLSAQFDQRQSDLARARSDFLANLGLDFNNFREQQNITSQQAKADAIARRAAQYGTLA